jgi:peptide chain release factor 2
MQEIKQRIDALMAKFDTFLASFDMAAKKDALKALEAKSTDPTLWNDQTKARGLMQELADTKHEIEEVENLSEEITTLKELSQIEDLSDELKRELGKAEKDFEKMSLKAFLSGHYDKKNALVSIHAGQGGTEAMDWSSMLYRMYLRFAERRGWETAMVDLTRGEEAGIKSVVFKVNGAYAYGYLKGEMGTHRLVRQSPFNADKLRQTSFALVEVLPELEEVDLPDIELKDEDIDVQFFHSSSQGGQNVQKVSTAVRLTHKPTGLVVTAQAERFQEQNRKNAMNLLRSKLWVLEQEKAKATKVEIKGEYHPASWGTQIRSYVLHPYKMVKDLRTEVETGNTEAVLDGEIDQFIEAELQMVKK